MNLSFDSEGTISTSYIKIKDCSIVLAAQKGKKEAITKVPNYIRNNLISRSSFKTEKQNTIKSWNS